MIPTLAIAVLELLAVVWACALLWVNAGLRRDLRATQKLLAEEKKAANSDFSGTGGTPPL